MKCAECGSPLSLVAAGDPGFIPCPRCRTSFRVDLFPAFFRKSEERASSASLEAGDATCFNHPDKRAVVVCDACGRFLCSLCEIEMDGRHICPGCLEKSRTRDEKKGGGDRRIMYDSLALSLAVYPIVLFPFFWLTPVTAPVAVFLALRKWNAPRSIVSRGRLQSVATLVVAAPQILLWAYVFYKVVR